MSARGRARHRAPAREQMTAEQAALYDRIVTGPRSSEAGVVPIVDADGRLLGPFALMTIAPGIGDAVQALGAAVRFRGTLPPRLRELAILTVAARHRSDFEWFAHAGAARAAGLDDTLLAALRRGQEPPGLDEEGALVWRATRAIAADGALADADHDRFVTTMGRERLTELVWLCGYYSMLAVALTVLDPELPVSARGAFGRDDQVGADDSGADG